MSLFEEVLPALRLGRKIRRKYWDSGTWPLGKNDGVNGKYLMEDLFSDDWEIMEEKGEKKMDEYGKKLITRGAKEERERILIKLDDGIKNMEAGHCWFPGFQEAIYRIKQCDRISGEIKHEPARLLELSVDELLSFPITDKYGAAFNALCNSYNLMAQAINKLEEKIKNIKNNA